MVLEAEAVQQSPYGILPVLFEVFGDADRTKDRMQHHHLLVIHSLNNTFFSYGFLFSYATVCAVDYVFAGVFIPSIPVFEYISFCNAVPFCFRSVVIDFG